MTKKDIRVLQIIDALTPGGAERVAISLTKGILKKGKFCGLCATRKGGLLEGEIGCDISFFILHKKNILDFKSLYKLITYIKKEKINVLHAHSTSIYTAAIAKIFTSTKLFWHDHFGLSEDVDSLRRPNKYKLIQPFISGVISVNQHLQNWAIVKMGMDKKRTLYLQNFSLPSDGLSKELPKKTGKVIVCIANMTCQKDYHNLLNAFAKLEKYDVDLWCIGMDYNDDYSKEIHKLHSQLPNKKHLHFLGSRQDIGNVLSQADIAVLSSKSEGLPLVILEYASASLLTVCTDVGQCSSIIKNNKTGFLCPPCDAQLLAKALEDAINIENSHIITEAFNSLVKENFSEDVAITKLLDFYSQCIN